MENKGSDFNCIKWFLENITSEKSIVYIINSLIVVLGVAVAVFVCFLCVMVFYAGILGIAK